MKNLNLLREQIDEVDNRILTAVAERMELVKEVGEYKKENSLPVIDPEREKVVIIKKIEQGAKKGLSENFIKKLWRMFIDEAYILENQK